MLVHIASPNLARRIRRIDTAHDGVVSFLDNLLIGPSSADPVGHAALRHQYSRGFPGAPRNLRSMYTSLAEMMVSQVEVIVWSSGSLQDTLLLWFVCEITDSNPATTICVISFARSRQLQDDQFGCMEFDLRPRQVRNLLDSRVKLGVGARRVLARNWRAFAGRLPTRFNERCHAAASELERIGRYHAGFFPRATNTGWLVSLFDELLLTCVGSSWSLPSAILMRQSPEGMLLRSWFACTGDVFVARRLQEWARHPTGEPVLESETGGGNHLVTGVRYRLSPRGKELLENGMQRLDDAPACTIGGGRAYDPRAPVTVSGDGGWKLVEHRKNGPR